MARKIALDSRSTRTRLKARREPYWAKLAPGKHLGYRRGATGGSWIARFYDADYGRRYEAISGSPDDTAEADGLRVLSYEQAAEKAREWFKGLDKSDGERRDGTVGDALNQYEAEYKTRGGKAPDRLRWTIEAHIRPQLGLIQLAKLRDTDIKTWLRKLAETPPRLRSKATDSKPRHRTADDSEEARRRRRSSANRVLTVLKAALAFAFENKRIASADAWTGVKPFKNTDAPRIRFLDDAESVRLVNACPADFRALAVGGLLTGCRYGELTALKVGEYDPRNGSLYIARSKSGKPRHVHLTDEGRAHFDALTVGRERDDLMFRRADGGAWGHAHQRRPMIDASQRAEITPAISFHVLRHTYASRLVMRGVPLQVVAHQLGHADTRITERHYAHLAPSYVADTVRAAFPVLGVVNTPSAVTPASRLDETLK